MLDTIQVRDDKQCKTTVTRKLDQGNKKGTITFRKYCSTKIIGIEIAKVDILEDLD